MSGQPRDLLELRGVDRARLVRALARLLVKASAEDERMRRLRKGERS